MANYRRALFSCHRFFNSTSTHNPISVPISPIRPKSLLRPCVGPLSRFYCSNQSLDIDLSSEESKRRLFNRLLYRSRQRGFLELDLVLGKWVEEHIHSMDENGIKSLVNVLDQENPDLWKWLTGQEQPPEAINMNPVVNNLNNYAAPETRATPEQQWVRGWDDFKKGRDGPASGNQ